MRRLPEDLLQYVRNYRLGRNQKSLMRELAMESQERKMTAAEYAHIYVKRTNKIHRTLRRRVS